MEIIMATATLAAPNSTESNNPADWAIRRIHSTAVGSTMATGNILRSIMPPKLGLARLRSGPAGRFANRMPPPSRKRAIEV